MTRIFIDASVLFAASLSATGASRELIRLSLHRRLALVVNELVLLEVERNLAQKSRDSLDSLRFLRETVALEVVEPTREEILAVLPYTVLKDAPHLASARKAHVYCLVSLDRKHMVDVREAIARDLGLRILLPGELLAELKASGSI